MAAPEFHQPLASDAAEQIERQCDLFERDLQAGQPRPITDYLDAVPPPARSAAFRALLGVERGYLADMSRPADALDYLARYPSYAGTIAEVFGVPLTSAADLPQASSSVPPHEAEAPAESGWHALSEAKGVATQPMPFAGAPGRATLAAFKPRRILLWSAIIVLLLALLAMIAMLLAR